MTFTLQLIVEGYGESGCLPALVVRYLQSRGVYDVFPHKVVINTKGCNNLKAPYQQGMPRGVEYWVAMAVQKHRPNALLIVLDADDDCQSRKDRGGPKLGEELLERARQRSRGVPVSVVVANRQFEAWLVAAWPQIRDIVRTNLPSARPEAISAKDSREAECRAGHQAKLAKALGRKYAKTSDQPMLAGHLPFEGDVLRNAPSYTRMLRVIDRLVQEMRELRPA